MSAPNTTLGTAKRTVSLALELRDAVQAGDADRAIKYARDARHALLDVLTDYEAPEHPAPRTRLDLLLVAQRTVTERGEAYGDPAEFLGRLSELWSTVLGVEVRISDAAIMLMLLKVNRILVQPTHIDSWVDAAGYASIGFEATITDLERAEGGE